MNILFDLISTQDFINGGGEYTKTVFLKLLSSIRGTDIKVFALYDSYRKFAFDDFQKKDIEGISNVELIDRQERPIADIIKEKSISKFFIGIGQKIAKYCNLNNINIPIICVIHDMAHQEVQNVGLSLYLSQDSFIQYTKEYLLKHLYEERRHINRDLHSLIDCVINSNGFFITVSQYSKNSMEYLTQIKGDQIKVLYSPLKQSKVSNDISDGKLKELIDSKSKYFLAVSANRPLKNIYRAINAYKRLVEKENCNIKFVTVGYRGYIACKGHIILPYLSETDLENAYKNCYAFVYTSFLEGFGYPPLEAMRFKRPVISSNVCSMPEILGDAPIYVSPFYETDIYRAMKLMLNNRIHSICSEKSCKRFSEISTQQRNDLEKLIKLIVR